MALCPLLRHTLRRLVAAPGFTATAVVALALGIGANGAVFSAIHGLLLRPLPFPHADRIVRITSVRGDTDGPLSVPEQNDLRALPGIFENVALYTDQGMYNASGFGAPEELPATITTHNLTEVLGIQPRVGTMFPAEFDRSRAFGLVISHSLWQRRFGGAEDIVGRTMTLDGADGYTIYGVLPPGVSFPADADLFRSSGISPTGPFYQRRDIRQRVGLARLSPDVTIERAQQEADGLSARLAAEYPDTNGGLTFRVTPLRDMYAGPFRPYLWLLAGAVALVFGAAVLSVANLQIARSLDTRRATAIRLALGAGRGHLVKEAMVESGLLALAGAISGASIAALTIHGVSSHVDSRLPSWMTITLDLQTVWVLAGLALISALIVGLAPVWRADADAQQALREDSRGAAGSPRQERVRRGLLVAEVTLAVVLVAGAGLLAVTFQRVQQVNLGFDPSQTVSFRVELGWRAYDSHEKVIQFNERMLNSLRQLPGVTAVGLDSNLPLSGRPRDPETIGLEGQSAADRRANPYVHHHIVSPSYFDTMSITIVDGRGLSDGDREGTEPVTVVSASLARRLWPDGRALGRRLLVGTESPTNPWMTVVGVAADIRHVTPRDIEYNVYRPFRQRWAGGSWFVARVSGVNPAAIVREATSLVATLDPNQSFFDVATLDDRGERLMWRERLASRLVGSFAIVATVLAVVGLAGLVSYTVRQRRREIGVRLALGAEPRQVLRTLIADVVMLVAAGVVIGTGLLLLVRRLAGDFLFEPSWVDYGLMFGLPIVLGLVATGAAAMTAWRGSQVPLTDVLRG